MKKLILGVLISASTVAFGQDLDCKNFKNGKFKLADAELGDFIIERRGKKQIEYGEKSKLKLEFRVKWLNDCSYTLELKKVIQNPNNIKLPDGMILTIEIIKTKENAYVQKTSSNLFDLVMERELLKID